MTKNIVIMGGGPGGYEAALMASKPPFAITHAPGHMFITDIPDSQWQV